MAPRHDEERRPLLQNSNNGNHSHEAQKVDFDEDDSENPRNWPLSKKYFETFQICIIAFLCSLGSSIFAPAIDNITQELETSKQIGLLGQSLFVILLGIGPLFLAPMSETFGRRPIFLINFVLYTLLQLATALAPNIATFIAFRSLSGFFGSVGIANGGGTISDMFETRQRAKVLGVYLIWPLLGPSLGPLLGGIIVGHLHWRWIFWIIFITSTIVSIICITFLYETNAKIVLQHRKSHLEQQNPKKNYYIENASNASTLSKIATNSSRAVKILTTQPIVLTLSAYQALVFSTMFTLYSQYTSIWTSPPYSFDKTTLALTYIGPALGFIITSIPIVRYVDKVYNYVSRLNGDDEKGQPEYRLPLALLGAICLPISLFWFGWTVEMGKPWPIPLAATLLFGASQVSIFNTVQTYYIDAYESQAASALAAGAFLRSLLGGIVPIVVRGLFEKLGYGWGMSVFGFMSVLLMPAPVVFYYYGRRLREKFPFEG